MEFCAYLVVAAAVLADSVKFDRDAAVEWRLLDLLGVLATGGTRLVSILLFLRF